MTPTTSAMPPQIRTRKPTGKPSWPILLLAGAEKTGKSYNAAVASSSDLISRTYWITIGEDEPDEYGQLGDFDIVYHDGSYQGILGAIRAVDEQPAEGVPLLVVDSMTRLWDLITSHAQDVANQRARRKGKASQDQDAQITMDLWNAAKDQWQNVMDAIRAFPGPAILTARLDVVAVMNDAGQPTPQKTTKVQAHKSLPFDVGAVIEMPARGDTWITGVRSVRLKLSERTKAPKDFSVDWFWRQLGLDTDETSERDHKQRPALLPKPPEQDEDGPRVQAAMRRDTTTPKQDTFRAAAPTPSAPPEPPSAAVAALEDGLLPKSVVADEWAQRVYETDGLDALYKLHDDAANRNVLSHQTANGVAVEQFFLNRRAELQQAAQGEPEPVPPVYEDETLPF